MGQRWVHVHDGTRNPRSNILMALQVSVCRMTPATQVQQVQTRNLQAHAVLTNTFAQT